MGFADAQPILRLRSAAHRQLGKASETLRFDCASGSGLTLDCGTYHNLAVIQWRLCFRWSDQGPDEVEIVDYHRG